MKFLKLRLMNEASEIDGGGDAGMSASDAFDYSSTAIIGEDNDAKAFQEKGLDFNKYFGKEDDAENTDEALPQGSEPEKDAGQTTDESAILERLNALGAIHNDQPVKIESLDKAKELIQQGFDYTKKTQALSEERKVWESERSSAESELNAAIEEFNKAQHSFSEQMQELEKWRFAINEMKENAPDVFEEAQRYYHNVEKQYSNPILNQQLAAIKNELAEAKKGLVEKENKLIVDSFEAEYAKLAHLEQSAKELGINVSKEEVKKKWAATGMSAEDAFVLNYGKMMMQAQASKSKVATNKAKVGAKPVGVAGSPRNGTKVKAIDPKLSDLAYASALLDRYKNI